MSKKILLAVSLVALLILLEIGFRIAGFGPKAKNRQNTMQVEPANLVASDSVFGFKFNPGLYHIKMLNTQYDITIDSSGHRAIPLNGAQPEITGHQIICLGGPSTFGRGINDDETYSFFLQSRLAAFKVRNLGLLCYGLTENYVQLMHLQQVSAGDLVVYVYHSVQDNRGGLRNQKFKNSVDLDLPFKSFRYLTLDSNLTPLLNYYHHISIPLSHYSAICNYIEEAANAPISSNASHRIAEKAFLEMNNWSKQHGCKFVLVYWNPDKYADQTLQFCKENDVKAIRIKGDIYFKHSTAHQPIADSNKAFADSLVNHFVSDHLIDTSIITSQASK
jgi:hypothetical protein